MSLKNALFTCVAVVGLIGAGHATASNDSETVRSIDVAADRWMTACAANRQALRFTGVMDREEIAFGLRVLQFGGLAEPLAKLSTTESCLSIVASSTIGAPVIMVSRPADFATFELHNPDPRQYVKSQRSAEDLGELLKRVGVGYAIHPADVVAQSSVPDWRMTNRAHRLALAQKAKSTQRSYASPLNDHCVIVGASMPFSDWFRDQTREVASSAGEWITSAMAVWHDQYADAFEFWHEVGHCTQTSSYIQVREDILGKVQRADLDTPLIPAVITTSKQDGTCTAEPGSPEKRDQNLHSELLSKTQVLQELAIQQEAVDRARDASILMKLQQEYFADEFGLERLRGRMNLRTPGCTPDKRWNEWQKSRLILNLSTPRPEYLTFLVPYFDDADLNAQRHALADAWDAVVEISDDYQTQNIASQLRPESASRYFTTPSFLPDANRQARWKQWLLKGLEPQGGLSPTDHE